MSEQRDTDDDSTLEEFNRVVNMKPGALEKHLGTAESQSVGWTHDGE